jgi:hypothetical protein
MEIETQLIIAAWSGEVREDHTGCGGRWLWLGALSLTIGVTYIDTIKYNGKVEEDNGDGSGRGLKLEVLLGDLQLEMLFGGIYLNHWGHLHREAVYTVYMAWREEDRGD